MSGDGPVLVLVADGDRRVRRALQALIEAEPDLRLCGEAASGDAVRTSVRVIPPTVILLGLQLPTTEEGLALLADLAQWPVVAISTQGGLREAALRAGAGAFVEKGAAPEVVLAAIRAVVRRTSAAEKEGEDE